MIGAQPKPAADTAHEPSSSNAEGFRAAWSAVPVPADDLVGLSRDPNQWIMQTGDYPNTRYSVLSQINRTNVQNLRVIWNFSTGVLRGHEGGPLVIGDVMYLSTPFPNNVFALDLNNNGRILWKYEPKQDPTVIPVMCCDTVNRGVAYGDGKIFLYQAVTTLVALDAKTGKELGSVKNGDPAKGETGTSAPVVVKDKVIVGISGGEFGVQGHLSAYNLKDGSRAWRAYSVGPDDQILFAANTTELGKPVGKDSSIQTWQGDQWKIGGGTTWGWISYDPKLNLIYYGSGNPSTWNPVQRPGDNKWSMTIFARNPDTGIAKWVYQMTPHDQWGYDGVNEMILVDINVKGQPTKALVHLDQNGFGYTLNRVTGALLVAEKFDPSVNWASKIDIQVGRPQVIAQFAPGSKGEDFNYKDICPAALGSKNQGPATFSPKTGLFYVPTNHVFMDYEPFKVSYTAGQPMLARRCRCSPQRVRTISATSLPGIRPPVRSCGPIPSRSRCGRGPWRPLGMSSSTARSKAT